MDELLEKKKELIDKIVNKTNNFNNTDEDREELKKMYSSLYHISNALTKITGVWDQSLYEVYGRINKVVYLFDFEFNKRFETTRIEKKKVYTPFEAENIVKSTINNTRDILEQSIKKGDIKNDYMDVCGFSQFVSIYPLKKMGLKITINNSSLVGGGKHAFGTVTIPVDNEGIIENRQYLIDCTYMQFFKVDRCVKENKNETVGPDAGYFIENDEEKKFIKSVIENGYFEVTEERLKMYLKGIYYSTYPLEKLEQTKEEYTKLDLLSLINSKQGEFSYDEDEFIGYGYNLDLNKKNNAL